MLRFHFQKLGFYSTDGGRVKQLEQLEVLGGGTWPLKWLEEPWELPVLLGVLLHELGGTVIGVLYIYVQLKINGIMVESAVS